MIIKATSFIANGDFNIASLFKTFIDSFIYIWSWANGGANLDGIIRLPFRTPLILAHYISGNVFASYSYIIMVFLFSFFSAYFFIKKYLQIKDKDILLISSILFSLNPVFLGNIAKLGLQLGASALPLMLIFVRNYSKKNQFFDLFFLIILVLVSLVHPFTFIVNTTLSVLYFLYLKLKNGIKISLLLKTVLISVSVLILLGSYFILPLVNLGSISKDQISQDTLSQPTDYTALVSIAKTQNLVEGFTFSRSVFLDFDFYNSWYKSIYIFSSLGLLALIIALVLINDNKFNKLQKIKKSFLIIGLLLTILLSDVSNFVIEHLIKFVIGFPGGWAFRAPLKWQLYSPLFLSGLLALGLFKTERRFRKYIYLILFALYIGAIGYVGYDVYNGIIKPKSINQFTSLNNLNLEQKRLLYVGDRECYQYLAQNTALDAEINFILRSNKLYVKKIDASLINKINVRDFDVILDCSKNNSQLSSPFFSNQKINDRYFLRINESAQPTVAVTKDVYHIDNANPNDKLVNEDYFYFIKNTATNYTGQVKSIFYDFNNIEYSDNKIISQIQLNDRYNSVVLEKSAQVTGLTSVDNIVVPNDKNKTRLEPKGNYTLTTQKDGYTFNNLLTNYSFENNQMWQKKVGDCYNFDDNPILDMKLINDASEGKYSLLLEAERHIACTGQKNIQLSNDNLIYVKLDYKKIRGNNNKYTIQFNDNNSTLVTEHLLEGKADWTTSARYIKIPYGATSFNLWLYTSPDNGKSTTLYDNFFITEVPNDLNNYSIVAKNESENNIKTTYQIFNPTKSKVKIENASDEFFLIYRDGYHKRWELNSSPSNFNFASKLIYSENDHFRVNEAFNAWKINTTPFCQINFEVCTMNPDGTYNIELFIDYVPQRWFYIGAIISGTTLSLCIIYILYTKIKHKTKKIKKLREKK